MDTLQIAQHNSIMVDYKFKVDWKDRLSDSLEKIAERNEFSNKLLDDWWKRTRRDCYPISPLLWVSFGCFYEAIESYRAGLFLGSALMCRAAIDNMLYSVIHWKSAEMINIGNAVRHRLEFDVFDNPQTVRRMAGSTKKQRYVSIKDVMHAGKNMQIIDDKMEKKINSDMEKCDIITHYEESAQRLLYEGRLEYQKSGKSSEELVRKFFEHKRPLLESHRMKQILGDTSDILVHLGSQMRKHV